MKSRSSRKFGRSARLAGMACVVLLASVIPGVEAAAARQKADVTLGYACQTSSGPQQARLRIEAGFPATGKAGEAIRPEAVTVTARIPAKALPGMGTSGAITVGGTANLTTLVTVGKVPATAEWQGLTARPVKVSKDGELVLAASGPVPQTAISGSGDIVFSASALSLALALRTAEGSPAEPPTMSLSCTPNLGQDTTVVVIPRSAEEGDPGNGGQAGPANRAGGRDAGTRAEPCPPAPIGTFNEDLLRRHPWPEPPDGLQVGMDPQWACGLVEGYSNVDKLKGAAAVKGEATVMAGAWVGNSTELDYSQQRSYGRALLEPSRATFLTFGFMPTTATVEIEPVGNMNIVSVGPSNENPQDRATVTTIYAEVHLRLRDVEVNGTPMDVGSRCRTSTPVELIMTGNDRSDLPYSLKDGGWVFSKMAIPAFAGCGVGEDLDRLFTASVSGAGNHVQLTQGPLCYVAQGRVCPMQKFGWTAKGGGTWSSTSTVPLRLRVGTSTFSCGTEIDGTFKIGQGLPGRNIGSVSAWRLNECGVTGGPVGGRPFTIKALELPRPIDVDDYAASPDGVPEHSTFKGSIRYPSFRATTTSTPTCTFDIVPKNLAIGINISRYDNQTQTMTTAPTPTNFEVRNAAGCPAGVGGNVLMFGMTYPGMGHVLTYP